jgi:S-adenosylmethionine-diacylglycerol 3-amino-3-carboxypropyl transferase
MNTISNPPVSLKKSKALANSAAFGLKDKKSLKDKLFSMWFDRLVYTQIWEDPQIDIQALQIKSTDHILTIASGGCNALAYLVEHPAKVSVVDLNHAHIALLQLKVAALKTLESHEDFFRFFGIGKSSSNVRIYNNIIRNQLDATSRAYWEHATFGFKRIQMFAKGFYKFGLLGQIIGVVHLGAKLHRVKLSDLLFQSGVEQQAQWFDQHVAKIFDNRLVSKIISSPYALYYLGIAPSQHMVLCNNIPKNMSEILKQRARHLATVAPISENYFAWQAFARKYDESARGPLPAYLMREHYHTLRQSLGKLVVEHHNIRDKLNQLGAQTVDIVNLLDAQDWMTPQEIGDLWQTIDKAARPGARVIFRTAGELSPVEATLSPELAKRWSRDHELSDRLGPQDRSGIYGAFHLYRLSA